MSYLLNTSYTGQMTFNTDFFVGNRQRLRAEVGAETPIIITANGLLQRNGDSTFKFRQDSNFWYLTGITQPDIILVMDGESDYLILPGRDAVREAFDGAVTADVLTEVSGISEILDETLGWRRLSDRLAKAPKLATLDHGPAYADRFGFYLNPARITLLERVRADHPAIEIDDIRLKLAVMRSVKQAPELAAIRQVIAVTIEGLQYVTEPKRLAAYNYEYEIEADLTRHFRRAGCGHAFDPVVASGERACQLHYIENNGAVEADKLLILDIGAELGLYAADISRTVVVGKPTKRQREVFEAVCRVQDYALSQLKPGVMMREYEQLVEAEIGKELVALGVIETAEHDAIRKFYPHAASHFMGLDVHDAGDYQQPLQAGMVLTCEPGIYIPAEGIGVRIEDDVLITEKGNEILTKAIPRSLT